MSKKCIKKFKRAVINALLVVGLHELQVLRKPKRAQ